MRLRTTLAREGRHRFSAVHVRTGRNGHGRDGVRGAHCKGCSLNCQHRYGCSRDQENFFSLLHFLPSLWNRPLGREENKESAQAISESGGIAWETKQGRLSRMRISPRSLTEHRNEAVSKPGEIGARITPALRGQQKDR